MQELEKERQEKQAAEEGRVGVADVDKPTVKFMISGEAPLLMSKACELLIKDLSFRAWRHTERNRRRTLQKQDIHAAVGESEVYDFLIDIVPRVQTVTSQKVQQVVQSTIPAVHHPTIGIPHGMHLQIPSGVHASGLPATVSLPHGTVTTTMDDSSGMLQQQMSSHQVLSQLTSQHQPQYHETSTGDSEPPQQLSEHSQEALHLQHHVYSQNISHDSSQGGDAPLPPESAQTASGSSGVWLPNSGNSTLQPE